jgi:hypothetical protein
MSGPYTIDKNSNKSDAEIWEAEMNEDAEDEYDRMLNIDALYEILDNELKRRAALELSTENKTTNNQQPTE